MAIGPLTNIALLLTQYPECVFNIRRLVIMGGSAGRGNFTPNAEFNIAIDPEAAAKVFHSGLEIVMCGLDVTNRALLAADYLATLPTLNQTGKMLHALFSHYRSGSMSSGLHACTTCALLRGWPARNCSLSSRALWRWRRRGLDRRHHGGGYRRTTGPAGERPVALDIDVEGFQRWAAEVIAPAP